MGNRIIPVFGGRSVFDCDGLPVFAPFEGAGAPTSILLMHTTFQNATSLDGRGSVVTVSAHDLSAPRSLRFSSLSVTKPAGRQNSGCFERSPAAWAEQEPGVPRCGPPPASPRWP